MVVIELKKGVYAKNKLSGETTKNIDEAWRWGDDVAEYALSLARKYVSAKARIRKCEVRAGLS